MTNWDSFSYVCRSELDSLQRQLQLQREGYQEENYVHSVINRYYEFASRNALSRHSGKLVLGPVCD
jgi:hypothetical protein